MTQDEKDDWLKGIQSTYMFTLLQNQAMDEIIKCIDKRYLLNLLQESRQNITVSIN
jgi:hypothetical protein